jgi:hypothetical protein
MDEHDDLRQRLRAFGTQPVDPARQSADLTAMAGVRPVGLLGSKLRLAAAFLAGLLIGSTGLAAADALPDPAQHVAHSVLDRVGVDVPDPERYRGAECGAEAKENHGAYVRDDHSLAQTDCGKKVHASRGVDGKAGADAKAGDPCHGRPPWAGNKTMTSEEKAAAEAERTAQCGEDDADEGAPDADADAERKADESPDDVTTTTVGPTTSTTVEESTTTTGAPESTDTTAP